MQHAPADPDELLIEAARLDPSAFQLVYQCHASAVYRYLRGRMVADEDAADLTATTFERALGALSTYQASPSGPRPWLLRIARNAAVDAARRRRPAESVEALELTAATTPGPEQLVLAAERSRDLRARVWALPEDQREAIVLRYAAGLTAREIGAVIGKSESAAQKSVTRALARLKESYGNEA